MAYVECSWVVDDDDDDNHVSIEIVCGERKNQCVQFVFFLSSSLIIMQREWEWVLWGAKACQNNLFYLFSTKMKWIRNRRQQYRINESEKREREKEKKVPDNLMWNTFDCAWQWFWNYHQMLSVVQYCLFHQI